LKIIFNTKIIYLLLVISLITGTEKLYAQSPLDSIEIYNPFTHAADIRRIVNNRLSILSGENKFLINKYAEQIEQAKKTKSLDEETTALIKSGDIFFKSALYNIAINYYLQALEKFEISNQPTKSAFVEIKIGRMYYFSDLVPMAKEYINRAYRTLMSTNDDELIAYANFAIGTVEENTKRAELHFKKALDIQRQIIKTKPDDFTANENLSKYLNANDKSEQALKIAEKIDDKWLIVLYQNNIGYAKAFEGKYTEAIDIFNRSLKISKAAKLKGLLKNTYVDLSVTYRLMGDWEKSARYKEIAAYIVESLYAEEFTIQTSEMKVKYDTKKKELENELLKKERLIMTESINAKTKINYLLIVSTFCALLFTIYFFVSRRKVKAANYLLDKQKEDLEILNSELKRSEENLNVAQSTASLANWEWNFNSDELTFSKEMPKIYGVDEGELKSNFRKVILEKTHPDDREQFSKYFNENFNNMQSEDREYRIIKDNKIRWIRAKRMAITDDEGIVSRVFGTLQDITESRKSEEIKIQMASQQSFTKQLLKSQEEERKRIAGELHDSLGQDILLIKNRAQLGLQGKKIDPFTIEQLTGINESTSDILNMVREISFDLRPAHLERLGLTETITALINKVSGTTAINFTGNIDNIDGQLLDDSGINFFRIIQESISNIIKHSESKNAEINIQKKEGHILVEINDDGKGFNYQSEIENSNGFGLNNILNRVNILNGKLKIDSRSSGGTNVIIKIPMDIK